MKKMIKINKLFIFIFYTSLVYSADNNITAIGIMGKVLNAPKPISSISEIELEIVRKRSGKTKRKTRAFLKYDKQYSSGDHKKKSLVKFLKPKSINGTGLLSWTKTDGSSDQWFFLPKLKMAKRVKSKEKGKSFMATDFIYEDLESRSINDDTFVMDGMDKVDNYNCIVILSKPIKKSSYWAKKIFVDERLMQIRKIEFFSNESVLDKTLFIKEIVNKGDYWLPTVLEMHKSNGNHTVMRVEAFKPDADLDDEIFTESFLMQQD